MLIKSFQVWQKSELAGAVALLALVVLIPAIMTHMNTAREAEEVFKTILIIREMINVEVANHYNDDKRRKKVLVVHSAFLSKARIVGSKAVMKKEFTDWLAQAAAVKVTRI